MFAGNFAPVGWEFCNGQLIPIAENDALFTLIGTMYGGDGQETFALPNLQSRIPIHHGNTIQQAESGGVESVTITTQQLPVHTHTMVANNNIANSPNPANAVIGVSTQVDMFFDANPVNNMNIGAITPIGGSQPHDNMMPFLCVSFIISLFGNFPPPS
jgi:microcystin-dependent protein